LEGHRQDREVPVNGSDTPALGLALIVQSAPGRLDDAKKSPAHRWVFKISSSCGLALNFKETDWPLATHFPVASNSQKPADRTCFFSATSSCRRNPEHTIGTSLPPRRMMMYFDFMPLFLSLLGGLQRSNDERTVAPSSAPLKTDPA
jgi:hypothetical protein